VLSNLEYLFFFLSKKVATVNHFANSCNVLAFVGVPYLSLYLQLFAWCSNRHQQLVTYLRNTLIPMSFVVSLVYRRGTSSIIMHPHTALLTPELLKNIFSFVGRNDNVNHACVCKQWSEIALDLVWRKVENILQLLTLLRPCQRNGISHVRHHSSRLPFAS